jgi:hypothetical protein
MPLARTLIRGAILILFFSVIAAAQVGSSPTLPYFKGKFVFATGSGVSLPTATNRRLGTGKLTIAPLARQAAK